MGGGASSQKPAVAERREPPAKGGQARSGHDRGPAPMVNGFPMPAPMLVQPFHVFAKQGRIKKSTREWRAKMRRRGKLVEFDKAKGHKGIFVSHQWWWHPPNRPDGVYDWGGPDYPSSFNNLVSSKANLKHRIICKAVHALAEKEGVPLENMMLWVDWQGISQDDPEEKGRGVQSLIAYTTLCDYMLVPTQQAKFKGDACTFPELIRGYGRRGWCRGEFFTFSLWAEMQPDRQKVQLYAATRDGKLQHYPEVKVRSAAYMPSGGDFTNPADRELVKRVIEDKIVEDYGKAMIRLKCEASKESTAIDLGSKMLGAVHMPTLGDALQKHGFTSVDLTNNQLEAAGAAALATALETCTSVAFLKCAAPKPSVSPFSPVDAHAQRTHCRLEGDRPLEIHKLRGTEPVESIDLSSKGLGPASAVVIATLIGLNTVTKSLKCAAATPWPAQSVSSR